MREGAVFGMVSLNLALTSTTSLLLALTLGMTALPVSAQSAPAHPAAQTAPSARTPGVVRHPLSAHDASLASAMRQGGISGQEFEELLAQVPDAAGVRYEQGTVGGISGWWARPMGAQAHAALLFLHGGDYAAGSARTERKLAGQLAARAGAVTFVPEYRLAPKFPFPAAVDDALAVYRGLVKLGYTAIALTGDSAGGGLALVTLSQATGDATLPRPRGAAVMSPWTDLSLTAASLKTRAKADPFTSRADAAQFAGLYLGQHDARDPLASPLWGKLSRLPPVRIAVGDDEVLLDDSLRYVQQFRAAGGDAQVDVWAGMIHVFPMSLNTLEASRAALDDLGTFLKGRLR